MGHFALPFLVVGATLLTLLVYLDSTPKNPLGWGLADISDNLRYCQCNSVISLYLYRYCKKCGQLAYGKTKHPNKKSGTKKR